MSVRYALKNSCGYLLLALSENERQQKILQSPAFPSRQLVHLNAYFVPFQQAHHQT
jgi:hypothetical protein